MSYDRAFPKSSKYDREGLLVGRGRQNLKLMDSMVTILNLLVSQAV